MSMNLHEAIDQARKFSAAIDTTHYIVRDRKGVQYWCPNQGDLEWSWQGIDYVVIASVTPDGTLRTAR